DSASSSTHRAAMVLVEPDPVVTQAVQFLPGFEVLGIGSRRDLWLEVFLRQRIRQLVVDFEVLELLAISKEIEDKDLHVVRPPPPVLLAPRPTDMYKLAGTAML